MVCRALESINGKEKRSSSFPTLPVVRSRIMVCSILASGSFENPSNRKHFTAGIVAQDKKACKPRIFREPGTFLYKSQKEKTTTVYDATNHTRWSSLDGFNHTFLNLSYSIVFLDQFSCFRSVLNFVFVLFSSRNHFSLGLSSMNISHVYSHTICGFAAHIFMGPEPPSQWSLDG